MEQVNGIRLREFQQVKKEMRGSTEHLIVGLDIAKDRHNAFFGTATGRTLHKGMFFDNTPKVKYSVYLLSTEREKIVKSLSATNSPR